MGTHRLILQHLPSNRILTCRPDLVVIGYRSAFPVGLSADSIGSGANFFIEGDDLRIGEPAHWGLEGG